MPKNSNPKTVTMRGGLNMSEWQNPPKKPPKADTDEPEEKKPAPDPEHEKPTE